MNVQDYLKSIPENQQVTFLVAHAVQDSTLGSYHEDYRMEYRTTPIRAAWEWKNGGWGSDYLVMNADHPPISANGTWVNWYNSGRLSCALVTTANDIRLTTGSDVQAERMVAYYDKLNRKEEV